MSKTPNSRWFTNLILSIGLLFLGICVVFVLQPQYLLPDDKSISVKDRIDLENKVRATWIQAISGLGLFVAAYSAWLNYQSSQKKLEHEKKTAEDNLELANAKQITERFSKAVEQLGNESITVRLGGIYSLERIAEESSEKYHWTIMEILTAFVRETSNDDREPDVKIPQDIQAALTVIGRRNTKNDLENERINLSGANLNGANLSEAKLDKANFDYAKLYRAKFSKAHLTKATFLYNNLTDAIFSNADLIKATFVCSDLTKAQFASANLTNASFFNNNFTDVKFFEADLTKAYFETADLTRTNFRQAKLIDAKFEGVNFDGANLAQADIEKASFIDTSGDLSITHNVFNLTTENLTIDNLNIEQILEAKNWDKAKYNPDFEKQLQAYLLSLFSRFITEAIF